MIHYKSIYWYIHQLGQWNFAILKKQDSQSSCLKRMICYFEVFSFIFEWIWQMVPIKVSHLFKAIHCSSLLSMKYYFSMFLIDLIKVLSFVTPWEGLDLEINATGFTTYQYGFIANSNISLPPIAQLNCTYYLNTRKKNI